MYGLGSDLAPGKKTVKRRLKYLYLKVVRQGGSPDRIARGVALGTFLGFLLPPGTQTVVALALAPILRCNAVGAACAVWVTNPLTMPIIYPAALSLGSWVTGLPITGGVPTDEERFWSFVSRMPGGGRIVFIVAVGLTIFGAVSSIAAYYGTRALVLAYRERRRAIRGLRALHHRRTHPKPARRGRGAQPGGADGQERRPPGQVGTSDVPLNPLVAPTHAQESEPRPGLETGGHE